MSEIKVGGEVDAHCTKCKMVLAHTVLAVWAEQIKRVRCNTCMGEHAYRAAAASPAKKKAASAKVTKRSSAPEKVAVSASAYESLVASKDRSTARRYNATEKFAMGELVEHPAFGLGVVAAVRGDKVDLAFPTGVKTLQHMKGSGPTLLARPPAPKRPDVEVTDESQQDPAAETSDEPELGSAQG